MKRSFLHGISGVLSSESNTPCENVRAASPLSASRKGAMTELVASVRARWKGKMNMKSMPERERYNGVLEKAIAILHVFSCEEPSLSPRVIAARTHLPLPTIYRLAHALSQHGLLEQEGQQFRPGVTLLRLGWLVAEGNDLRRRSLPYLHWLNEQTQENAELHIRQAETHIAIAVLPGTQRLRYPPR